MVSALDLAKRALVTLLKSLAVVYNVSVSVTRDASDKDVRTAYRKVSRKAHPDHGGSAAHQTALNKARDAWDTALEASKGGGAARHRQTQTKKKKKKKAGRRK